MIRSLTRLPGGHTTRSQTTSRVSETAGGSYGIKSEQSLMTLAMGWKVSECAQSCSQAQLQPYYCCNHKDLI